jgi:1-acyl-sn-glycerol-3-phosphate acyltransferase
MELHSQYKGIGECKAGTKMAMKGQGKLIPSEIPRSKPIARGGWGNWELGAWREKPWHARLVGSTLTGLARFVTGVRVHWVDCQPDTCQRVYFANHTSHLDPVVLWSALPPAVRALTRPVAAKDYWTAGFVRRYLAIQVFNAILIDRMEIRVNRNPVDVMLQELGDRHSLIVFPEGGRTPGPEVAPFKSGLYYLCKRRPELELVPVYIGNMNRILPRGEVLPVPMLASVTFGPPMWLEARESKTEFLERARQAVERLREI